MRFILVFLALLGFLLPGQSIAESQFKVGQTYRNFIELQKDGKKMQVPLTEGEWIVAGVKESLSSPEKSKLVKTYLFKVRDNFVAELMIITFPYVNYSSGWKAPKNCEEAPNKANYYENISLYPNDLDCWHVEGVNFVATKPGVVRDTISYIQNLGFKTPSMGILVRFYLSKYGEYLRVVYFINPEVEGVSKAEDTGEYHDYHPDRIKEYPDKKAFVEKFISWAKKWKNKVDLGFAGKITTANI